MGFADAEDRVVHLLGTCFAIAPRLFMSANHVFGVLPSVREKLRIVSMGTRPLRAFEASVVYQDQRHDIAIARVDNWPIDEHLQISTNDSLIMNENILSVEYSSSRGGQILSDGRSAIFLTPNWHKGHMVREYEPGFSHEANDASYIDLSFPALKGASGAPVIGENSFQVLGMILSNVETQLMPAQVEITHRTDGTQDEIRRYFLPSAHAIRAEHLRSAAEAFKA
jgi:hypothetical protein